MNLTELSELKNLHRQTKVRSVEVTILDERLQLRQRHRERDRQRERARHRQTDRHTERERDLNKFLL